MAKFKQQAKQPSVMGEWNGERNGICNAPTKISQLACEPAVFPKESKPLVVLEETSSQQQRFDLVVSGHLSHGHHNGPDDCRRQGRARLLLPPRDKTRHLFIFGPRLDGLE